VTSGSEGDAGLHDLPGHLIRRLQQAAVSLFLDECGGAGYDITPVQYAALIAIATYPDIDQASLAGLIAFDRATIAGVIDRLEGKGLVRRATSPNDGRIRQLKVEPAGEALLSEIRDVVARAQDRILSPLNGPERATFMVLLDKLVREHNQQTRVPMRPLGRKSEKRRVPGALP
jgi:DNA-binding MarR family transcriptional regulator